MSKKRTLYECRSCGHTEPKWLGQCPNCGEWNTLTERRARTGGSRFSRATDSQIEPSGGNRGSATADAARETRRGRLLRDIDPEHTARIASGIGELDRALGGGLIPGSTILIGGEPGIGKSTLMLQLAGAVAREAALYVSGEESASQIRRRAERLGLDPAGDTMQVSLLCTSRVEDILDELERTQPRVVVVDSVQTMISPDAGAVPGTANQLKVLTGELAGWAHETRGCVLMVAHVTKEGQIAGPKVIEHMVDAVLLFEHAGSDLRFLRATKNRFGATEEVGIFTMEQDGLSELRDPGRVFLGGERGVRPAGVVAAPCHEGSRVLVVELQALVVPAKGSVSRSFSDRIDSRRVSRVAAVLEKHVGVQLADQDLYVNVAGGIRIQDVAIDLPLALALYSAYTGRTLPAGTLACGELTLAGEIRPISHQAQRERAAVEMGFETVVGPSGSSRGRAETGSSSWRAASTVASAIREVFGER